MIKKVTSFSLLLVLLLGSSISSLAANIGTAGGSSSTVLKLSIESPVFSVTVPTSLALLVDKKGEVTPGTNAKIINNSLCAVRVVDVKISSKGNWSLVAFNHPMNKEKVNSKKLGFKINGCETKADGNLVFSPTNFPAMDGIGGHNPNELAIDYTATVSRSTVPENLTGVADILFTLDWDQ